MITSRHVFPNLFKQHSSLEYVEREKMPEIRDIGDIPVPLVNYVNLIRQRKSPYYEIVEFLMKDMEMHFYRIGQGSEAIYAINPRTLQEQIEKKVRDEKLTSVNVCRTVLAMLHGAELNEEKDYFVTTTSSGRRNYHIKVNPRTLNQMSRLL
jgi:hypothetical protein